MSKRNHKSNTPAAADHDTRGAEPELAPSAAERAEHKAVDKAPEAGAAPRSAGLEAILRVEAAQAAAKAARAAAKPTKVKREPGAKRTDTFEAWVTGILADAGRPVKVSTLVEIWVTDHPKLGIDAKGAREARDTETAALERATAATAAGDDATATAATAEAVEAHKRAERAALEQAQATTAARIYTLAKREGSEVGKAGKGEVEHKGRKVA